MQLDTRKEDDVLVVICLEDRMDAKVAVGFREEMARLIDDGNKLIVLDVSNVSFIDSSGLGSIVSSLKMIGRDGNLAVAGAKDTILDMFRLTRMDRVFQMFTSEEEAIKTLSS